MDDRDRISRLPDEILLHILTFLPTKYAVTTSSLSHRWNNLGFSRSLPIFDFQTLDVQNWDTLSFVNFVNNLIRVNNSPEISKFRLKTRDFSRNCLSSVNEWIRFVFSKSVIELDLRITLDGVFDESNDEFCLQILPCETLEILRISSNFGLDMPIPDSSFGNLRIFHFDFEESPLYRVLVGELFTKLPLLEELSIRAGLLPPGGEMTFNIVAPALKIFLFTTLCDFPEIYDVNVVIDAPLLEIICLVEDFIASYTFKNFLNLSEAKICVGKLVGVDDYNRNDSVAPYYNLRAKEILRVVSNAKSISLSSGVVLALAILPQIDLPIIPFLKKVELVIPNAYGWKLLLPMLENSPNLEVLTLTKMEYQVKKEETRWYELEPVVSDVIEEFQFIPSEHLPTCLLLHLKEVEIRGVEKIEEFKVLDYVIENAKVMKKLTIHPVRSMDSNVSLTRDEIVAVRRFDGLQARSKNSLL